MASFIKQSIWKMVHGSGYVPSIGDIVVKHGYLMKYRRSFSRRFRSLLPGK